MVWRCWMWIGVLLTMLSATGCVSSSTPAATPPISAFKVALLLPGPIDDASWSQAGYAGLLDIERELGAQTAYRASLIDAEIEGAFRAYAEQGFDLVIGHGSQFYPAAEAVAGSFPRTKFAVVGNFPGNNRNLGTVSFRDGENSYLAGVVAALKSKTGRIAYIGGVENDAQREATTLIERGARAINPNATLSVSWVQSWTDQVTAEQLAAAQVTDGADVLIQNADSAGKGVFAAAQRAGVYAIGWAQDQHHLARGTVLTSAIQRVPVLLLKAASLVRLGRWEGKRYAFGLRDGALELAPFYGLLTPQEEAIVRQMRDDILAGKINTLP